MTVKEMLSRMDSRELAEWAAYYSVEPFGEERGDLRAGIVASVIANVNRGKNVKAYGPQDFMPYAKKESSELDEVMALKSFLLTKTKRSK